MIPLELYRQNYEDLTCLVAKLATILMRKELTEDEQIEILYCQKILKDVLEKQLFINANL